MDSLNSSLGLQSFPSFPSSNDPCSYFGSSASNLGDPFFPYLEGMPPLFPSFDLFSTLDANGTRGSPDSSGMSSPEAMLSGKLQTNTMMYKPPAMPSVFAPPPIPTIAPPSLPPALYGDLGLGGGMTQDDWLAAPLGDLGLCSMFGPSDFCVSSVSNEMAVGSKDDVTSSSSSKAFPAKSESLIGKKRCRGKIKEDDVGSASDDEMNEMSLDETDFFECGIRLTMIVVFPKENTFSTEEGVAEVLEHVMVNGLDLESRKVECRVTSDLTTALKGDEPKIRKRGRPPKKKRKMTNVGIDLGIDDARQIGFHCTVEIADEKGGGEEKDCSGLNEAVSILDAEAMGVLLRHTLGDDGVMIIGAVKRVSLIGVFERKLKAWEEFEEREEVRRKRKRDRERSRRMRKKKLG